MQILGCQKKVLSGYVRIHQNKQEKCRKGYFEAKNKQIYFPPFETLLSCCALVKSLNPTVLPVWVWPYILVFIKE